MKTEQLNIVTEGFYDPAGRDMWVSDNNMNSWDKRKVVAFLSTQDKKCFRVHIEDGTRCNVCATAKTPSEIFSGEKIIVIFVGDDLERCRQVKDYFGSTNSTPEASIIHFGIELCISSIKDELQSYDFYANRGENYQIGTYDDFIDLSGQPFIEATEKPTEEKKLWNVQQCLSYKGAWCVELESDHQCTINRPTVKYFSNGGNIMIDNYQLRFCFVQNTKGEWVEPRGEIG